MSIDQPPLWPDGWEREADRRAGIEPDEQAFRDLHGPPPPERRYRPVQKVEIKGGLL